MDYVAIVKIPKQTFRSKTLLSDSQTALDRERGQDQDERIDPSPHKWDPRRHPEVASVVDCSQSLIVVSTSTANG
jgi:hypothetical protein